MRPLENLLIHQMDVKTAYLHAPIDYDIYINPPEGYEETDDGQLYKLEKSHYGLNQILHDCLTNDGYTQNPADHCVYTKESKGKHNHMGR